MKMERKLLILFGSQTGTAEEVAERIGRESLRFFFNPIIMPMNNISIDELCKEKIAIFVASTTGQGEDPDNMKTFFLSLWNNRGNRSIMRGLKFGVLGLGDSSYQKFNFASKRLNKLLGIVGAEPIIDIGLADDQHDLGLDFVLDSWLITLWNKLFILFPLPKGTQPLSRNLLPAPKFEVKFLDNDLNKNDRLSEINSISNSKSAGIYLAEVTSNLRKTSLDHFQDVRLIEFDVKSLTDKGGYRPGDVVMIQPQNTDKHVDEFLDTLGLDGSKLVSVQVLQNNNTVSLINLPTEQPCTIRQYVKNYFDIQSIPKRYFFELLSHFTTDETEKEKFIEFTTAEGQQELYNYCNRPRRTVLEVLADFPFTNRNIPFKYLFNLIPSIKPRAYSIASSHKANPGKIQILMAVVCYSTILKRPRLGLCSNWLAELELGSVVSLRIKSGGMEFPDAEQKCPPVVMIGPGTGCAPFRSYIQERIAYGNHGDLVIIFGCRGKEKDYFFKQEWEQLSREGKLHLFCAFSRDQEDKIYVQHVMKEHCSFLWKFIGNEDTKIYYAGNAKRIPIDVYEALQHICEKSLGISKRESEQFMKRNIEKRYQTESWA